MSSNHCNGSDRNRNKTPFPAETPIGMAYIPFQQWETPFPENRALEMGTIFPSLFLPFEVREGVG